MRATPGGVVPPGVLACCESDVSDRRPIPLRDRLRSSGDRVAALELLAREEPHFPHQAGLARILQVELLVELGRNVEAIARLRDGLDRGFRYRGWWFAL